MTNTSEGASHNTKWGGSSANPGWDRSIPKGTTQTMDVKVQSNEIPVSCAQHTWMNGFIWAFDHPFAAVTDKDGNFEIPNVPAGTKLKIIAWHEKAGYLEGGNNGTEITVKDGENKKDFKVTK